jgi:DNA replication protein DnaC
VTQNRTDHLLRRAQIPARYEHCDLANYKTENCHKRVELAKVQVETFTSQYPIERRGLLITGPSGVGKTHLSVGIIKQLVAKGFPCLFCDYREVLKTIQNSYNASVQVTELDILRPIFEAEVLVLDDLGAVRPSEWVWDTVSLILNSRYNDNRTTIITTNFEDEPAAELAAGAAVGPHAAARRETLGDRIGERMLSRLHEMCIKVKLNGKDFRDGMGGGRK